MNAPASHQYGADHARHDHLLMARAVAGELDDAELLVAEALVARCAECRQLALDLRLVNLGSLPIPTPPRTRDFRITPEQAERVRDSIWERALRLFAGARLRSLRPVAGAVMSLGLVLMVVGGALPSVGGGPASPSEVSTQSSDTFYGESAPGATGAERPALGADSRASAPPPGNDPSASEPPRAAGRTDPPRRPSGVKGDVDPTEGASSPLPDDQAPDRAPAAPGEPEIVAEPEVDPPSSGYDTPTTQPEMAEPSDGERPVAGDDGGRDAGGPSNGDRVAQDSSSEGSTAGSGASPALLASGGLLVMVGAGLLLLRWFARRTVKDPFE